MPLANITVINRWFEGRRGTSHNMRSDGNDIWSYDLKIGQTRKGKKEIFNYTWATGITTTSSTSSHINILMYAYGENIDKALSDAGLSCCTCDVNPYWTPRPIGEVAVNIRMHGFTYNINDEQLLFKLNARYSDLKKITKSWFGSIVDPRLNWRKYIQTINEHRYLGFARMNNYCVVRSWLCGYGLRSRNLWTDGRDIKADWGCRIIGKTRKDGTKILYDYTAKTGNFKNRAVSMGVGEVKRFAKLEERSIKVVPPNDKSRNT